jgi:ankyrin repeat protein
MKPRRAIFLALCMAVLLANAAYPESSDRRQDYPLLVAALQGNVAQVKQLLDAGASPDFACHGVTPLIACSLAGHKEVAELLLARGANVNFRSEKGPTALMTAAANDHAELVQFLLDHDAEPNLKASFIWTQLNLTGDACRDLDQLGVVDELCVRENCCMTALCVASDQKTRDILIQHGATE